MLRYRHRGSTAAEVGLVLTLVSCGLLVTYSQLGGQARKAFHRLTLEELASSGGSKSGGSHAPEASPAGGRGQSDENASTAYSLMTCGAVLGLLGLAAVLAVRKRRAVVTEDELPPEPVAKISELPEALFAKRQDLLHLFENLISDGSGSPPTVDLVMSNRLSIAQTRTPASDLRRRMKEERLRHLLVCDLQGKLLGVVSDRDLAKPGETAEQIMSKAPIAVSPKTPLISAVTILINRRFSSLPVVEEERPVGILTTTDILLAMQASVMLLQKK